MKLNLAESAFDFHKQKTVYQNLNRFTFEESDRPSSSSFFPCLY